MAVRTTMANLIAKVRSMINDPAGGSQTFADQDIQDQLDVTRDDVRYEQLTPGPGIVNSSGTNNQPEVIWSDYYSQFRWWEDDVTLQGVNVGSSAAWIVLSPVLSENFVGHWAFQNNLFTTATAPGQYPPVFATGKVYDPYVAAARLLEIWAAQDIAKYDFTTDGQSFRRSQLAQAKFTMANIYRKQARVRTARPMRTDIQSSTGEHVEHVPLLGHNDDINRP